MSPDGKPPVDRHNDPPHLSDVDGDQASSLRLDPVYVHAKRETNMIIGFCVLFLIYTLVVCGWWGYDPSPQQVASVGMTWGMPTWAFWGLLVPWVAVNGLTIVFCFFWMKNDELSDPDEEAMLQKMASLGPQASESKSQRGDV